MIWHKLGTFSVARAIRGETSSHLSLLDLFVAPASLGSEMALSLTHHSGGTPFCQSLHARVNPSASLHLRSRKPFLQAGSLNVSCVASSQEDTSQESTDREKDGTTDGRTSTGLPKPRIDDLSVKKRGSERAGFLSMLFKDLAGNLAPREKGDIRDVVLMSLSFAVYVYISQKLVCAYCIWQSMNRSF
ncbi:hypothetical protein KP509_26G012300 [Ceratopteris richardii]|uniref:Uncharacterized protein n=2 Tax=Ceratopteris richardii TaxID=49495 RepID=A0A8T2RK41_CERRI|nr:hypothetical protein KP509_26G012300 [Ceratopteris richardii]